MMRLNVQASQLPELHARDSKRGASRLRGTAHRASTLKKSRL
jgi:hypothetical protein